MRKTEKDARRIVRKRSGGRCEVCGLARAAEFQHRKNRSQGGQWHAANGLDVCSPCHRYIHDNPAIAAFEGWTVLSWEEPGQKFVKTLCGYRWHDDEGDVTNLGWERPVESHTSGCGWWTTNVCDCEAVA